MIDAAMIPTVGNKEISSLMALLIKGGWVMLPILLLSILTLYVFIERLIVLQKSTKIPQQWLDEIKAKSSAGDMQSVQMLCEQKQYRYAIARIIQAGIGKLYMPIKAIERIVENVGQAEVHKLEKNLALLGTVAGAAPMLGFLGTVIGMIQAFMAMAQETQQISPQLLSGGIYEAMITTAAGLIVGIAAYLGYNYLLARIRSATHGIEYAVNQFIAVIERGVIVEQNKEVSEA